MTIEQIISYITQRKELAIQLRDDYKKYYYLNVRKFEVEKATKYYNWSIEESRIINELDKILEFMKGGN